MGIFLDLFFTFAKIGLFTFGGGYAMIALIEHSCVEQKGWITQDEMLNLTVIAESTPGPIAINCATYVGCKMAGIPGALAATAGMVAPSFGVIYGISLFLDHFLEIPLIANAFQGIKIAVGLLIVNAALTMIKKMPLKGFSNLFIICSAAAMLLIDLFSLDFSSVSLMLAAGGASLAMFLVRGRAKPKGGEGR